jgi:hypothetical protein
MPVGEETSLGHRIDDVVAFVPGSNAREQVADVGRSRWMQWRSGSSEERRFGVAAVPARRKSGVLGAALGFAGEGEGVVASEDRLRVRGRGGRRGSGGVEEKDGGGDGTTRPASMWRSAM